MLHRLHAGHAPFWSSSVNGRPTFTESHQQVFTDTTGTGRGSATIQWPTTFNVNPTKLRPLVIFISSRNNSVGTVQSNDGLLSMKDEMNTPDGVLVLPIQGKTGSAGSNSWNGSLCCCWEPADGTAPDDTNYIAGTGGLIDRVIAAGWPVDPKRVFIYAQGGGGSAIAFRVACDHADKIAAVWDYAGSGPRSADTVGGTDPTCSPSQHVSFFHLHGSADTSAEPYSGQAGTFNAGMVDHCPAAINSTLGTSTMDQLKAFNGCSGSLQLTTAQWEDLVTVGSPTNETDLYTTAGCPSDGAVLFGTMNGEDHSLTGDARNPNWKTRVYEFFTAHPKP